VVQVDGLLRYLGSAIEQPFPKDNGYCCVDILLGDRTSYYSVKPETHRYTKDFVGRRMSERIAEDHANYAAAGLTPAAPVPDYYIDVSKWAPGQVLEVGSKGEAGMLYWQLRPRKEIPENVPVIVPKLIVDGEEEREYYRTRNDTIFGMRPATDSDRLALAIAMGMAAWAAQGGGSGGRTQYVR
jgi:hypothetical protein